MARLRAVFAGAGPLGAFSRITTRWRCVAATLACLRNHAGCARLRTALDPIAPVTALNAITLLIAVGTCIGVGTRLHCRLYCGLYGGLRRRQHCCLHCGPAHVAARLAATI